MKTDSVTTETQLAEARARAEAAANGVCDAVERDTGTKPAWHWFDERELRIYEEDGRPMMSLFLESVQ